MAVLLSCERPGQSLAADPLQALGGAVAALRPDADATVLESRLPAGAKLTVESKRFTIRFEPGVDAATLAKAWGWARPYAISGDVHQRGWQLELYESDLKDPYGKRIATAAPSLGAWRATVGLAGRPQGDLPEVVAGASPAYDLTRYRASVTRVVLEAAR